MITNYCIVHHYGAHSHKHIIFNGASVYNGQVTDAYIITNAGAGLFVCAVDNYAVLDIDLISDPDRVHIASHYSIEPYTAVITKHYVANNRCIGGYKTILTENGRDPFNR